MRLIDAHSQIEIIERGECLRLLSTEEVGRIAFITGGGSPDVLPVNYVLDGDAVVFATGEGSKLSSAERGPVTFEVDRTHAASRSGWSVVIHGHAEEVTQFASPDLLHRLRSLPINPWAGGNRPHVVRVAAETITGRRVGSTPTAPLAPVGRPGELSDLDYAECVRLLTSHRVGRIAFAHEMWPLILPVNYVFDDPNVLIRTGPGAKLESAPMTAAAFEIDGADPDGAWGWSVVVQGPVFDVTDALDDYSQRLRLAPVDAWAPGDRTHWLKITVVNISGRCFGTQSP